MKQALFSTLFAICFFASAIDSQSETYIYEDENIKIQELVASSSGIEFVVKQVVKKKSINLTPNSSCKNSFLISPTVEQFETLTATLLTAKSSNKKIGIEYDIDYTGCWVPVIAIGIQ